MPKQIAGVTVRRTDYAAPFTYLTGRLWDHDDTGYLTVYDTDGLEIAVHAPGWETVGYVYEDVADEPEPVDLDAAKLNLSVTPPDLDFVVTAATEAGKTVGERLRDAIRRGVIQ